MERWVFIEIQELKRGPLELMAQRRTGFKVDMDAHLKIIEDMLHEHRYLLDEKPSLADFAVFGAVNPLPYSDNRFPEEFVKLQTWFKSIEEM